MRIATDFDGTFPHVVKLIRAVADELLVVTGQHPDFWENTRRAFVPLLWSVRTVVFRGYPGYATAGGAVQFTDAVLEDIANWKADMVKEFKADYYFDDDIRVLIIVKQRCPDTVCCLVA